MNANASRGTPASPSKDSPAHREREVREDPHDDERAQHTKRFGPDDEREDRALQFVLLYAPPDTSWRRLWEVYQRGLDPREVWAE